MMTEQTSMEKETKPKTDEEEIKMGNSKGRRK